MRPIPSTLGAVRESDMRKVRDTCLFFCFFFSQNMIQLACAFAGYQHDRVCRVHWLGWCGGGGGGGREWVNPTNCDCVFKMWCSAGGKQDPSKFMPLCEREEKGSGVEVEGIE